MLRCEITTSDCRDHSDHAPQETRMRFRFPTVRDMLDTFVGMGGTVTGATEAKAGRLLDEIWTEGLHMLAGLVIVVIARHGPFGRRNGAMALWATERFYELNGWELVIPSAQAAEDLIRRASDGTLKAADL